MTDQKNERQQCSFKSKRMSGNSTTLNPSRKSAAMEKNSVGMFLSAILDNYIPGLLKNTGLESKI